MGKLDVAGTMLAEERRLVGFYNRILSEGVDPEFGALLQRMIGAKLQYCSELERFSRGDDATAVITKQINDLYL